MSPYLLKAIDTSLAARIVLKFFWVACIGTLDSASGLVMLGLCNDDAFLHSITHLLTQSLTH